MHIGFVHIHVESDADFAVVQWPSTPQIPLTQRQQQFINVHFKRRIFKRTLQAVQAWQQLSAYLQGEFAR